MKSLQNLSIKAILSAYLPPMVWGAFIFFLSSQPNLPSFSVSVLDFIFKKCSHVFVYTVLYFLTYRAINFDLHQNTNKKVFTIWPISVSSSNTKPDWRLPFLLCILYAVTDETHQAFTPHRTPTLRDIGYDFIGAGLAFLKIYRYI